MWGQGGPGGQDLDLTGSGSISGRVMLDGKGERGSEPKPAPASSPRVVHGVGWVMLTFNISFLTTLFSHLKELVHFREKIYNAQ